MDAASGCSDRVAAMLFGPDANDKASFLAIVLSSASAWSTPGARRAAVCARARYLSNVERKPRRENASRNSLERRKARSAAVAQVRLEKRAEPRKQVDAIAHREDIVVGELVFDERDVLVRAVHRLCEASRLL